MASTVITPFTRSRAIELSGRLWRKRLLPVGEVAYKGRMLRFTRDYIEGLADAFHSRAYGQVPFQLAPGDNRHTNDPERFAGEIIDAEAGPDGLWVTLKATPRGEKILTENPDLGVSARIVEDYERSDGRFFPAAVQHVLGTLDPRIPELGPWQAIEASADPCNITIDLSGETFGGEAGGMLAGLNPSAAEADLLGEVLDELAAEDEVLANWAESGDPAIESILNAMLADADDMPGYGQDLDDLSGTCAEPIDLSGFEQASAAIELAREQREKGIRMTRWTGLARGILHGDLHGMCEAYASARSAGHRAVELAQEYGGYGGQDSREIELARFTGDLPGICGTADAFGRCGSPAHDSGCSHCFEAGAAYGATPADADAWREVLQGRAGQPAADSHGRIFRDQHGSLVTMRGHVEALSGQRQGESPFYAGRDRRELTAPQRQRVLADPSADEPYGAEIPPAATATARALAAQAGLVTSADATFQRLAWQAEHQRRVADRAVRTSGRSHPDYGETMRDRRERLHQPVQLSNAADDGLFGALPTFTHGQL